MISIVIPLYNKEDFITETIQSVLNQTFTDFELLIVNDGSSDASVEFVNNFKDDRIRVISIENSGVSVARNTGIKAAKHNWIALLDADDWWAPTFLEEMVAAILRFPEKKIFASGRSRVFQGFKERYQNKYLPKDSDTKVINYFKVISRYLPIINSSNVIIMKSHFDEAGFFRPGQGRHEDHDLWMRLSINNLVVFVNKNLSFYRKTGENTASQDSYSAKDFSNYLETLITVKSKVSEGDKAYFEKYYKRFTALVYLKYTDHYTIDERQTISKQLKLLLGNTRWKLLKIVGALPLHKLYIGFKKLRR